MWERSSAASTSSRMYMGAGLNSSRDRMREGQDRLYYSGDGSSDSVTVSGGSTDNYPQ